MHVAELCDQVASLATAHDRCGIFDIMAELEQGVWGLASHIGCSLSTLAKAFAMMLKRRVHKWA